MSPAFSRYFACLLREIETKANIFLLWVIFTEYPLDPDLRWIGGHRTVAIQPDLTISDNEANLPKAATSNKTHSHPTTQILFGSIHEHWSWAPCQILSLITIIIRVATTFENEKHSTIVQNSGTRICTLREAPFWNVLFPYGHCP